MKKHNRALSELKAIIQIKGQAFARLTGIPYDTLKSVESGRLKMTNELAWEIRAATGVVMESILPGSKKPMASGGPQAEEYTAQTFHRWRANILKKENPRAAKLQAEESARVIAGWVKLLYLAGAESTGHSTLWSFSMKIGKCLDELAKQAGLVPSINRTLKSYGDETALTMTGLEWKKADENILKAFGVTPSDLKRMQDYTEYEKKATSYPHWNPSGGLANKVLDALVPVVTSSSSGREPIPGESTNTPPRRRASPARGNA